MKRDLQALTAAVGPRLLIVAVVACAVTGAALGAVREVVRQHGLPYSPKGTPPS